MQRSKLVQITRVVVVLNQFMGSYECVIDSSSLQIQAC